MSEEKRQHEEMLKEVDEFFAKYGLTESVEAFLASEQVKEEIDRATQRFIGNMRKMEEDAPSEKVKEAANELRTRIEAHKETMAEEIIASFKAEFKEAIELALMVTEGLKEQEYFFTMIKENIPAKGIEDIKGISARMLYHNSKMFMLEIYKDYVPDTIPEEILRFMQMLFGTPLTSMNSIFPEWYDDDSSNKS